MTSIRIKARPRLRINPVRGLLVKAPEGFEDSKPEHTSRGNERDIQGASTQNRGPN